MKMIKNLLLSLTLVLLSTIAISQSGWNTGQYYQNQGESWTEWQYEIIGYDYYGNPIYQKFCRDTQWYSEYYSGYVNVWGPNGWYSQWYEGYSWYCRWSLWYACY